MTGSRVDVVLPVTLHARPAARIARVVADGPAHVRVDGADGRSVTELMCLGARAGQQVALTATGPGAEQALASVRDLIEHLGDRLPDDEVAR